MTESLSSNQSSGAETSKWYQYISNPLGVLHTFMYVWKTFISNDWNQKFQIFCIHYLVMARWILKYKRSLIRCDIDNLEKKTFLNEILFHKSFLVRLNWTVCSSSEDRNLKRQTTDELTWPFNSDKFRISIIVSIPLPKYKVCCICAASLRQTNQCARAVCQTKVCS